MTTADKHSLHSSEREEYIEYILLADLCSVGWKNDFLIEVSRAHTDAFGYDLVLSAKGIMRHVQVKASVADGKTKSQKVNRNLMKKPSGCVVWLKVEPETLRPVTYGWFGGLPGHPLPELGEKSAMHTKANSKGEKTERPNLREVSWPAFEELKSAEALLERLFGKN